MPVYDIYGAIKEITTEDNSAPSGAIGDVTPVDGFFLALSAKTADAGTNTVTYPLTVKHNSSGTPAANFGVGLELQAETTTTEDTSLSRIRAYWATATHASRKAVAKWTVYDTAEREAVAIEASGTAAKIGFFGAAPVVQPTAYTPSNVTPDKSYDADSTTTAELADVLGTLIADLQALGLIA